MKLTTATGPYTLSRAIQRGDVHGPSIADGGHGPIHLQGIDLLLACLGVLHRKLASMAVGRRFRAAGVSGLPVRARRVGSAAREPLDELLPAVM